MSQGDDGDSEDFDDPFLRQILKSSLAVHPPPLPGERLGGKDGQRFEILEQLGSGGMGQVVRARDELLQRVVALKFIAADREFTRQILDKLLEEEARLIAQLDHENIVRIFDVSEWNGSPFLIMECLEGQSLNTLLRKEKLHGGTLELHRALHIFSEIMAGLAHVHSRNVIHRDLKPSNVFVLENGRVKLLDFGLAWLASSIGASPAHAGTHAFMAPEQWEGQSQDMRTDTWAAGLLLYQMLTGELPYPIEDHHLLHERVLAKEPVPPVRTRRPDLPEPVDRFLARALAKDPARRFQSALEMRERLRMLQWSLSPSSELLPPGFIPHRRQVTLVCCRLSAGKAPFDSEDLSDLQAAFHQACARILEGHGGWIALRMGDEVLGCFGYPLARENDVVCAVKAALELTRLAESLPQASQSGLSVQVGVHTDMVVLDVVDSSGRKGHSPSLQGEAPRTASGLAMQAAPNTANLSENTLQGVAGNFVTDPLGSQLFPSSMGEVRMGVHRLVAERSEPTRFGRARTRGIIPLVGRTGELRQLLASWERACQGQGSMVLVRGEAGIGKSRLLQELVEHVFRQGMLCVSSQCWPHFSRSAFHPVLEWGVQLFGLELETAPAQQWACLEKVLESLGMPLPESLLLFGGLLGLPTREDLPPLLLTPELQRERTLETLISSLVKLPALLERKAGAGAVLLVLEDLHWADPSTLELLSLLQERLQGVGLCVLMSTRPELRLSWEKRPGIHRLVLDRLAADETAEMVRRLTENRPGLSARMVGFLVRRTEGIPLYVEELTRMLLARAPAEGGISAEGSLPVTLQELLLARLDPLPQEQKELAWMGAVIGRSFTQDQLAALSERDKTVLERDLEELVEAGLLVRKREGPEYAFRHALIHEAAYASLLKPRRRRYHHRVAGLLETPAEGATAASPELIAHHYTLAGEQPLAIRFWIQAGELALRRSAFEESVGHLHQALRYFRRLPEAARKVEEELRLLVLLGQALVAARGYAAPEVEQLYARVADLFPDVKDTSLLVAVCRSLFNQSLMRVNFTLSRGLAKQIVSLGQRIREPELLVIGWLMGGITQLVQGDLFEARRQLGEAVAQGTAHLEQQPRELGMLEPDPLAMAQAYHALVLTLGCEQEQGEQLLEAALQRTMELAHLYTSIMTNHPACVLYQMRFDGKRLLETTEQVIAMHEQNHFPELESWMQVFRGWTLACQGRQGEGYALLLKGIEQLRRVGAETGWPYLLCLLADAQLRLGLIPEGLDAVAEALACGARTGQHLADPELYRLRGALQLHKGRSEQAQAEFRQAIQIARQAGMRCIELRASLNLCHLLYHQGKSEEALRLLSELLGSLPPGLDSHEVQAAQKLLSWLREAHAEQRALDEQAFDAPWDVGHI
jgi:class 3 adenylate cyclase/tetratricopeptide (TPR) repeat protein